MRRRGSRGPMFSEAVRRWPRLTFRRRNPLLRAVVTRQQDYASPLRQPAVTGAPPGPATAPAVPHRQGFAGRPSPPSHPLESGWPHPHRPSADWFAGPLHTAAFRSNGEILRGAQGNFSRQLAKEFGARELKVLPSFLWPKFFSRLLREFVCAPTFTFISPHRCH